MIRVRALRGVCIGVNRHLARGDTADLEPATVSFLASIGAVERLADEAPKVEVPEDAPEAVPAAAGASRRAK